MTLDDISSRLDRLNALGIGLCREIALIGAGDDPLLHLERQAYFHALREAASALESAPTSRRVDPPRGSQQIVGQAPVRVWKEGIAERRHGLPVYTWTESADECYTKDRPKGVSMAITSAQQLKVYALGSRRVVYAPAGRGEDLRLHLASQGIASQLVLPATSCRLELDRFVDAETVQAVLDDWEG